MKKKILLTLFLVLAMMLTLVLVASAETPSRYIEFKVMLEGSSEYITVYTVNAENQYNPKIDLNKPIYSDIDFTQEVDKQAIIKLDLSQAVAYNANTSNVTRLAASSTPFSKCVEAKLPAGDSTVDNVPNGMFKNWTALKTVDLGYAYWYNDNCFEGSGIEEFVITANITRINNNSFKNCLSLKSIKFEGNPTLGSGIFYGCTALETIDLGNSLSVIGGSMFQDTGITEITLPDTITTIGSCAFMGTKLVSLNIPAACTELGVQMVEGVTTFTTINFAPSSQLKKIGHRCFQTTGLTTIELPDSLEEIAYSAFSATAITELVIPASVETIGKGIVSQCKNLTSLTFEENSAFAGSVDSWLFSCPKVTTFTIPAGTTAVGANAFEGCTSLTSIVIPSSVTSIGNRAFFGCTGLTSVEVQGNVTSVGESTFQGCTALTSITFANEAAITSIGNSAFNSVPASNLFVPSNVTSIGSSAYSKSGILNAYIPASCTSLGNEAFANAKSLTSVIFQEGYSSALGSSAFMGCSALTTVVLSEGITAIPSQCFWSCGNGADGKQCLINEIILPDSVKTLAGRAFANSGIRSIVIRETSNLEKITGDAFSSLNYITEIYLPKGVEITSGSVFNYCGSLEVIHNLEYAVMNINGEAVFPVGMLYQCMALKEVRIPEGVTKITGNIFRWYGLEKLYIPSSVTTIEGSFVAKDHVPNTATIYFCGGDADDLVAMCTSGNAFIQGKIDAGSVAEYSSLDATYGSGAIVNNVNNCDVYYAGIHEENDNITLVWLDKDGNAGEAFLSYLKVACPCGRGCGEETVIETLAPLFVDRGFAYGPNSMLQGVAVDRELLDEYGNYFTGIKYGLVAAAKSAQASASIIDANGVGVNGYVAAVDYTERDYDLFEMNLFGISEDYQATEFYFGAYVIADGQVYYIHNGTTNNEAQAIAYDDVVMIVDALIPEKEEE